MIITTNILALPLVLILWTLDAYAFLLSARLVLQSIHAAWASRANVHLTALTEPVVRPAERLMRRLSPTMPSWMTACTVLLALLLGRWMLIRFLIWISS